MSKTLAWTRSEAKDQNGEPTRLALANNKWNGSTVKTVEQARKLYSKGKKLLAQAKNMKK